MTNLFLTIFPFFIESLYCCLLSTLLVSLKSNCLISLFEIVLCLKTSHTRTESHCQIFRSDKHTGAHICTQHTAPQYKCTQYIGALAHTDAHWHTQQSRQRHRPVWRWSPITPMGSDPWDHEIMPNNPFWICELCLQQYEMRALHMIRFKCRHNFLHLGQMEENRKNVSDSLDFWKWLLGWKHLRQTPS